METATENIVFYTIPYKAVLPTFSFVFILPISLGEVGIINMGIGLSDLSLIEDLKPWLIDRDKLNLSSLLGSGQFDKVFKGTVQLNDGRHYTIAAKTLKSRCLALSFDYKSLIVRV